MQLSSAISTFLGTVPKSHMTQFNAQCREPSYASLKYGRTRSNGPFIYVLIEPLIEIVRVAPSIR